MYINVHGHQIFAKCTLNECTKMELDPPPPCMLLGSCTILSCQMLLVADHSSLYRYSSGSVSSVFDSPDPLEVQLLQEKTTTKHEG